jgi:hypothetical protein
MTRTGTDRGLGAVLAGPNPELTVPPPIRSCRTKRWRAATMLPHSNPTQSSTGSNHVKVKTRLRQDKTLLSVEPGGKGEPSATCYVTVFIPDVRFHR